MNRPLLQVFTLLVVCFCLRPSGMAQSDISICRKAKALVDRLEDYHFSPVILDDSRSEEIFKTTLDALDPDKVYFTQTDLRALEEFRTQVDDEVKRNICTFPNTLAAVFEAVLNRADQWVSELLTEPLDYTRQESVSLGPADEIIFCADESQLRDRWRKRLKLSILDQLFTPENDRTQPETQKTNQIMRREAEVRAKIERRAHRNIGRLLNREEGLDNYVGKTFLVSLCEEYDPHSSYFSFDEKRRFEQALSTDGEIFGFRLRENRSGQIEIARLMPGGPAWKSNQMNKGDVLLRCKVPGGDKYDLTDIGLEEFEEVIREPGLKRLDLTLQKQDGQVVKVSLSKAKVRNDEDVVKSMVLDGPQSIGYISLPGFYTEWENDEGSSCANDMAREVVKLKQEGISGIILDLRNNGGGSVTEAMDLAGIFIDRGPLMLERYRDRKARTIKDANLGFVWDGPLVVMVNGLSASASEFVAATLQDYNRAVIVGSTTFGKSTSQIIMPIDPGFDVEAYNLLTADIDWGFVKVTIGKYNRVTGQSHQKKGVVPDVPLPGLFEGLGYSEASRKNALEPDKLDKKVYFSPGAPLPVESLKAKSQDRIDNDNRFIQVVMLNDTLKASKDLWGKDIPLELEAFRQRRDDKSRPERDWEEIERETSPAYDIRNPKSELTLLEMDPYRKESNELLIDKLGKDFYLEEAYRVLEDLIQMEN